MSLTKVTYSMIAGEIANILDYGAVSGSGDATSAIHAAIASGKNVYIPAGNYSITSLSINSNNFMMYGDGDNSILTTTAAANIAINVANSAATENVCLRRFKLVGNATNLGGIGLGSIAGTAAQYTAYTLLDEVTVRDFRNSSVIGFGLSINVAQELEVRNCKFINNFKGVYRPNLGSATSTLFCGKASHISSNGVGFYSHGAFADVTIRDVIFESSDLEAIFFDFGLSFVIIENCYFEGNAISGGTGVISISGNSATPYEFTKASVIGCAFHINGAGGAAVPNVYLDKVVGAVVAENLYLFAINAAVITTANSSVHFIGNKSSDASNLSAVYRTLLGKISASDFDENLTPFSYQNWVSFPATAIYSTDKNTLDTYEEGTFVPVIYGETTAGTGTYVVNQASFTRVGNILHFFIDLSWSNHTGTGNMLVGFLPYTASINHHSPVTIVSSNITLTASNTISATVAPNNNWVEITQMPVGGGAISSVPIDIAGAMQLTGICKIE